MRAVTISEPGGPEVLKVGDVDVREAGPGEVRIEVRAAAVNPTDIGLRQSGVADQPPPWIPGMDAAGTIESAGDGVEHLSKGARVMAALTPRRPEGGAQAELIVVPAASVVPIPEGATIQEAATLPMNGLTAILGLEMLGLNHGDSLAISGGAGLLASYVIALAKRRGLRVIADSSPDDDALVRGFGADVVVPRGDGFVDAVLEATRGGADGLYDTALLRSAALPAIRDGGGIAVVRGWPEDPPDRDVTVHEVRVATVLERTDWLEELRELASSGGTELRVAAEFTADRAAEAHELMDAGGLRGRALIVF
jgi:NADPH:quinone reductase-like Zn-dependent oxidoreductase